MQSYWHKQTKPLFEELEWNKPERRDQAGRLLIVGGNLHALNAPAKAYELTRKTGIGSAKIALPDKTKKLVGSSLLDAVFLPSTSSGEFSQKGSTELLEYALWADSVLLPGDTGRNSQTSILLETLLQSYNGQIILTRDALDSIIHNPSLLFKRERTTLVASFAQLQKLVKNIGSSQSLHFSMDLVQLVEFLHVLTSQQSAAIVATHQHQLIVAADGQVSTTKLPGEPEDAKPWRLQFAALAACYQTWNPSKPFESLSHASWLMNNIASA